METVTKIVGGKGGDFDWKEKVSSEGVDLVWIAEVSLNGLKKRSRQIVIGSLILCGFVYGASLLLPKHYVTTSFVTLVRARPKVEIVELEQLGDPGSSREQALLSLAVSGDIISETLRQTEVAGVDLVKSKLTPDALLKSMAPTSLGDLLGLSFQWDDPVISAMVANQWARVFVKQVNEIYAVNFTAENRQTIERDYASSLASFREANRKWASFLKNDSTQRVTVEISEKQKLMDTILDLRQHRLNERATSEKKYYSLMYDQRLRFVQWLEEARSLADQIRSEKAVSAGSRLALVQLKSKVFSSGGMGGGEGGRGPQLQIDLDSLSSSGQEGRAFASDVIEAQELAQIIEKRLIAVNELIVSLNKNNSQAPTFLPSSKDDETGSLVKRLEREINTLKEELAIQEAKKSEIKNQQEVAADTFQSISTRMQLVSMSSNSAGNEVRLASQAYPPKKPISPRPLFNAGLSFVFGFFFLGGWAVVREILLQ